MKKNSTASGMYKNRVPTGRLADQREHESSPDGV